MRLALAIVLMCGTAAAQQFVEVAKESLPLDLQSTQQIVVADFDGDGWLDCFRADAYRAGVDSGEDALLLNRGDGTFVDVTATHLPTFSEFTDQARAGDFDGDGDLDLVSVGSRHRIYRNDGTAHFTELGSFAFPAAVQSKPADSIAVLDADNDGDLDLFSIGVHASDLLLNDGTGRFSSGPPVRTHVRPQRPTVVAWDIATDDLTGDGNCDLLIAGIGELLFFVGDGTGRFLERTPPQSGLPSPSASLVGLATGDIDGDGDLDLLVPRYGNPVYQSVGALLLVNDGAGMFTDVTASQLPNSLNCSHPVLADLEGDGDLDALLASEDTVHVFRNDGSGRFTPDLAARPVDARWPTGLTLGDADRDGFDDLFLIASETPRGSQRKLYLSQSGQTFLDASRTPLVARSRSARTWQALDVDGDGDLDLLGGASSLFGPLLINDGSGRYVDESEVRLPSIQFLPVTAAAGGDVDGDGDPDLVVSDYLGEARFYRNLGAGQFQWDQSVTPPPLDEKVEEMRMADLNGDGNLDVVTANFDETSGLFLGDGQGSFTRSFTFPIDQALTRSVSIADLDGDGSLDVFFTSQLDLLSPSTCRMYLNNGTGVFSDFSSLLPSTTAGTQDVVLLDSDQDGDLDAFIASSTGVLHWRQDLAGFVDVTAQTMPSDPTRVVAIAAGDLDGTGQMELVLVRQATDGTQSLASYSPIGGGSYVETTAGRFDGGPVSTQEVALADTDLDGDLDVVVNRLLSNHFVQSQAPRLARRGNGYPIIHSSRRSGGHDRVATFLSPKLAAQRIAVPGIAGTFALDPRSLVSLPVVALPVGGDVTLPLSVPASPTFQGRSFYLQALFTGPSEWRFGNVTSDEVH